MINIIILFKWYYSNLLDYYLMLLYNLVTNQALDQEESENGKVEVVTYVPSGIPGGGLIPIGGLGKKL